MAGKILARSKAGLPESEKITINLGFVDLGHVDLLVQEGFFSNRSDSVRSAIRQQLLQHTDVLRQTVARKTLRMGLQHFTRADLEAVRAAGERLDVKVLGLASIAADVTPELARATFNSLVILGALSAPANVKAALADRMC